MGAASLSSDLIIVGGGAAGVATAASLLRRRPDLDVTVIEPSPSHYYQPGWTFVGSGIFSPEQTVRPTAEVMPKGARWLSATVAELRPERSEVVLKDGTRVGYRVLVVAAGIKLDWNGVEGLRSTLGRNGVTSNYRFDLAPYTWSLVSELQRGRALFTQAAMPIKCAGAPQKAMYLACDTWRRIGRLDDIAVEFHTAAATLFGVPEYVPALERYIDRYAIDLQRGSRLIAVEGPERRATFEAVASDGRLLRETRDFDMLHVCPPQVAPDIVRESELAGASGFLEVDPATLQHPRHANVFSLGDSCSAPNAKTAAAVRQQAPVVAVNALAALTGRAPPAVYDGYGSCPLTVERGRIVLAEFGYGGKLLPTFPSWILDGRQPSRLAWALKTSLLPALYWNAMLKGREWLATPRLRSATAPDGAA